MTGAVAGGRSDVASCDEVERLFSYMTDFGGKECGNVAGSWCASGSDYVAGGNGAEYFAYCAEQL